MLSVGITISVRALGWGALCHDGRCGVSRIRAASPEGAANTLAFGVVIPFEEEPPAAASGASMADIDETDSAAALIPTDPDLDRMREAAAALRAS